MNTRNPALKERAFRSATAVGAPTMTVDGTLGKLALLLIAAMASASYTWKLGASLSSATTGWLWGGLGIGFVLALVISFKPNLAPTLALPYALAEGLFLGAISGLYHAQTQGIAVQAVLLTIGIAGTMAMLYRLRIIRVTERFRSIMFMAIGAIMATYLLSLVLRLFGTTMPFLHSTGPIGIGISVVFVVVASLALLLDFDLIERGAKQNAPKHMEWYGAFALMVTLVWLYIEVLRLLSKLQSRD